MAGLKDKVVLITGASSGIGEATALHLAGIGCKLSLVARSADKLEAVAAKCREVGSPDVIAIRHDVGDLGECEAIMEETVGHFGGLDVLINNAGVMFTETLDSASSEAFDTSMNVNVKSAMKLTQLATKFLEASTIKAIVNVSSIAGLRAYPGALPYKLSKAAMDQLTRCSALEVAKKGIRVNSVNPGVIDTDFFVNAGMSAKDSKKYVADRSNKTHPLGRAGRPDEVAKTIAFLASLDASFIAGQTLAVDGGRSVQCPS